MRVLVLCGGRSAERDVSCVSAAAILRNLRGHRPLLVWIDPRGRWWLQKDHAAFARHPQPWRFPYTRQGSNPHERVAARLEPGGGLRAGARLRVDAVFPVLHGPFGEDGTLQGFLEMTGLPYVGSGVLGSAAAMDKEVTKRLARLAGLPLLPYAVLQGGDSAPSGAAPGRGLSAIRRLKYPLFVKPCRLGSSIGVYKVERPAQLQGAIRRAFRFDTTVIVEQGVPAREIECAVLGPTHAPRSASTVGEIRPRHAFYSYEAKYLDPNGAELLIPARLSPDSARAARRMAERAFTALGCHGLARLDFLMDKRSGRIYFNEANTMPGFTQISMYPKLWEASGLPFPRLLDRLLAVALKRHRAQSRLRITRD